MYITVNSFKYFVFFGKTNVLVTGTKFILVQNKYIDKEYYIQLYLS